MLIRQQEPRPAAGPTSVGGECNCGMPLLQGVCRSCPALVHSISHVSLAFSTFLCRFSLLVEGSGFVAAYLRCMHCLILRSVFSELDVVIGKPDWELGNEAGFRFTARQIVKEVASVPHSQLGGAVQLLSGSATTRTFRVLLIGTADLVSTVEGKLGRRIGVQSITGYRMAQPVSVEGVTKKFSIRRGLPAVEAEFTGGFLPPCGSVNAPQIVMLLWAFAASMHALNQVCVLRICRDQVRRSRERTGGPTEW